MIKCLPPAFIDKSFNISIHLTKVDFEPLVITFIISYNNILKVRSRYRCQALESGEECIDLLLRRVLASRKLWAINSSVSTQVTLAQLWPKIGESAG